MNPRTVRLPDGRVWLRVADPEWKNPLDPAPAGVRGGRWNPPGSHPTLYLNGDVVTARNQIERLLADSPVRIDDLDDSAYVLVAATLPRGQVCADAAAPSGLRALGLADTYPRDSGGAPVPAEECRKIGVSVQAAGLRGVWCRSAATPDGTGRELAWFPATVRSRARAWWRSPRPLSRWRAAATWADLGLREQPEP